MGSSSLPWSSSLPLCVGAGDEGLDETFAPPSFCFLDEDAVSSEEATRSALARFISSSPRRIAARSPSASGASSFPDVMNRTVAPSSESTGASTTSKSRAAMPPPPTADPRRHLASSSSRLRDVASSPSESLSLSSMESTVDELMELRGASRDVGVDGSLCVSPETSADLLVRVLCAEMSFPASPDLTSASA